MLSFSYLLYVGFLASTWLTAAAEMADIVAIVPDRSTAYPNGLHNGLWLSAKRLNLTLEVRSVGNFDPDASARVLQAAIDSSEQPKVYTIWPVDYPSRLQMQELYDKHQVPIIQINQLPGTDSQWEWDHLLGYAGPDDALRARNAGIMLIQAMKDLQGKDSQLFPSDENFNVIALGYPETYGGYHLSIDAFEKSLEGSSVTMVQTFPLNWGTQPAYEAVLKVMEDFRPIPQSNSEISINNGEKPVLHGIYAMDDSILMGAHQALVDLGFEPGKDVILVGTVCNGARELLESGAQYGTTVQAPFLEGKLAIAKAAEYMATQTLQEQISFTPNPIATAETWNSMFVNFLDESSTVDELCTWNIFYERMAGPTSVDLTDNICKIIQCEYIPQGLFYVGLALMGVNYLLAILSAILLFVYRNKKIIVIAQPFFLALVIGGSMVDNTSIAFMSRDNQKYTDGQLDRACAAWPILLSIGHMITTATLVARLFRVKRLIEAGSQVRRIKVSAKLVSLFIVFFVSLDAVVLAVWYTKDPYVWTLKASAEDLNGYVTQANGSCSSEGELAFVYPLMIGILHLIVLLYANLLAYQTSPFHRLSDSKSVAIALFNAIQLLMIGAPILALVGDNVTTSYLIRIFFVFLNNFGVLALILLPKLYQCVIGNGDVLPEVNFGPVAREGHPKSFVSQSLNSDERRRTSESGVERSVDEEPPLDTSSKTTTKKKSRGGKDGDRDSAANSLLQSIQNALDEQKIAEEQLNACIEKQVHLAKARRANGNQLGAAMSMKMRDRLLWERTTVVKAMHVLQDHVLKISSAVRMKRTMDYLGGSKTSDVQDWSMLSNHQAYASEMKAILSEPSPDEERTNEACLRELDRIGC